MKKLVPAAKDTALNKALHARDKEKASKIFNEIKQYLTPGDRQAVSAQIAKMKPKKKQNFV